MLRGCTVSIACSQFLVSTAWKPGGVADKMKAFFITIVDRICMFNFSSTPDQYSSKLIEKTRGIILYGACRYLNLLKVEFPVHSDLFCICIMALVSYIYKKKSLIWTYEMFIHVQ